MTKTKIWFWLNHFLMDQKEENPAFPSKHRTNFLILLIKTKDNIWKRKRKN